MWRDLRISPWVKHVKSGSEKSISRGTVSISVEMRSASYLTRCRVNADSHHIFNIAAFLNLDIRDGIRHFDAY